MAETIVSTASKTKAPRFDYADVDIRTVDPDTIDLGTNQADCALIAQTFERGAHSTPTEAAVFSTLSRTLQNNKSFAQTTSTAFKAYLGAPQEDASSVTDQATSFAAGGADISGGGGSSAPTQQFMQSLNIGTQQQATHGDSFGEQLLDTMRDCIPCSLRLSAFLELKPDIDLLGAFEIHLETMLSTLQDVADLLNDLDAYGDFCDFVGLFSFMCIPDLQRIIAMLMALFILEVPEIDGLIGLLSGLVVPIFAPILTSITTLLDQFIALVTNPLDCVVSAINKQLRKLNFEAVREARSNRRKLSKIADDGSKKGQTKIPKVTSGIKEMKKQIEDSIQKIRRKMDFYIQQIEAMVNEMGGGDTAFLKKKLNVLQIVRMIAFVIAIINALSKGHAACSNTGKNPEASEIDNFFQNFLSPQSPFNLYVDSNGQIKIDEQLPDLADTLETLNQFGNVLQFEGESLLDPTAAQTVEEIAIALTTPAQLVTPCKLETTAENVEKVNQWITELNQT